MTETPQAQSSVFTTPGRILTGPGCFAGLGEECQRLGRRALIVCGRGALRRAGRLDQAAAAIAASGGSVEVFDQVEPEPGLATVEAGRGACRDARADVVVGIGGGSALDVAKAIAGLVHSALSAQEHLEGAPPPDAGLPIVAVPTTAGTGSEATPNSVLSSAETATKKSIRGPTLLPRVAIVDPELLVSLPRDLTAYAGLDALTQAIEAYTSRHATPLTDALAYRAFCSLAEGLPRAMCDGSDLAARTHTANGSLMAGMALANARLGVVHGLAHPLGIRYHIPHGLVCAALLPSAIRLNQDAAWRKYELLSQAVGRPLIQLVEDLVDRAGLTGALSRCGIQPADFPELAEQSLPSGSLKANPKPVTKEDLILLLEQATA